MSQKKPESFSQQAELRQQEEALRVANSIQVPGQTKEQTRQIAKGIEKGIALYKQQQKAKARERDRARKKGSNQHHVQISQVEPSADDEIVASPVLPALSMVGGIFSLASFFHLLCYFLGWRFVFEGFEIPTSWSLAAALLAACLSGWLFRVAQIYKA